MSIINSFNSLKSIARKVKRKIKSSINFNLIDQKNYRTYINSSLKDNLTISCNWNLAGNDNEELRSSKIFCLGIRIFDITNSKYGSSSSCIMKEIQVNKSLRRFDIETPIEDGFLLIELGYRHSDGKWRKLAESILDIGNRVYKENLIDDSWFYLSPASRNIPLSLHERIYQLTNTKDSGGSERVHQSLKKRNLGGSEIIQSK